MFRVFAALLLLAVALGVWGRNHWSEPGRAVLATTSAEDAVMSNQRLAQLLDKHFKADQIASERPGLWVVRIEETTEGEGPSDEEEPSEPNGDFAAASTLLVMTDEKADRMRMMMPIRKIDLDDAEHLKVVLLAMHANYDRALDARYALHSGVLWSAFIHPLSTLSEKEFDSALRQVVTLRENTGTSYSSGELLFAPGGPSPQAPPEQEEDTTI